MLLETLKLIAVFRETPIISLLLASLAPFLVLLTHRPLLFDADGATDIAVLDDICVVTP